MTKAVRSFLLEHTDVRLVKVHPKSKCHGRPCTIHNRSDHIMRDFPQHWCSDRGLMERTCPHGVGHPDPDEIDLDKDGRRLHGCDGCCFLATWEAFSRLNANV